MADQNKPKAKLTLVVRDIESLEARASPSTTCPVKSGQQCEVTVNPHAAKLTAVAFF